MKNASRLLTVVSILFCCGFAADAVTTVRTYNETMSAPLQMYLWVDALIYLVPALLSFLVGRLLARRSEKGIRTIDTRHKYKYRLK